MPHEKCQSCIEVCNECVTTCEHCAASGLQEPEIKMMARCIELDRDCADVCSLAAQFMSRGSPFAGKLCALCAEICQACGDECAKHKNEHCQRCAETCHRHERRGGRRRPARCDDRRAGDALRRGHLRRPLSQVAAGFQNDERLGQSHAAADYGHVVVDLGRRVGGRDRHRARIGRTASSATANQPLKLYGPHF